MTVAAVGLVGAVPYAGLINGNSAADTLAFLPFWSLQDTGAVTLDGVAAVAVAGAIALGAAFLLVPRRLALVLPAAVLAWFALTLAAIETNEHGGIHEQSLQALFGGTTKLRRPTGSTARSGATQTSRSCGRGRGAQVEPLDERVLQPLDRPGLRLGAPAPGGLPSSAVRLDPRTGRIRGAAPAAYG